MALSNPTNFQVRQRFSRTDDAFMARTAPDRIGLAALPDYEERVYELSWTENEAGSCRYEVLLARGTADEQAVAVLNKGIGNTLFVAMRRERVDTVLADWSGTFTGTFSVRAKSDADQSSWVDVTVTADDPAVSEFGIPTGVTLGFSAAGLLISWTPAGEGYLGTRVTLGGARFGTSAFVRGSGTSILIPHGPRSVTTDDYVISASIYQKRFVNSTSYPIEIQQEGFRQNKYTYRRKVYGSAVGVLGPAYKSAVTWADAPSDFQIYPATLAPFVGQTLRFDLQATVAVDEWELLNTPPAWATLDGGTLVVTPDTTQQTTIDVQADASSILKTTKIIIRPRSRPAAPVVRMSSAVLNNGFVYKVGEDIAIQPTAGGATEWRANLPDGLRIDPTTGRIFGTVLNVGRFMVSVEARTTVTPQVGSGITQSATSDWSSPLEIPIKITPQDAGVDLASVRFPWLDTFWQLTDLQVDLIGRQVSTSRLVTKTQTTPGQNAAGQAVLLTSTRKTLVIKPNDTLRLAVIFLLGNAAVEPDDLNQIRVGIRPKNNLDDYFFFETAVTPSPTVQDGAVYYLLEGTLENAGKESLLDALDFGEETSVAALAEIEWVCDGNVYSSLTFDVDLEMDVIRDS